MHLLYVDDSGSVSNTSERYFVLAGVAVFERRLFHLITALDDVVRTFGLGDPNEVELHGSPMYSGRKEPWHSIPRSRREEMINQALATILDGQTVVQLFAMVIDKRGASPRDPAEMAFEDISNRFNMFLQRLNTRRQNDQQRGLMIVDESRHEGALQTMARDFRETQISAPCGAFMRLSECLPQSALRHDPWYNDFVLKGGVRDILAIKLYESRSHMLILGLHEAVGDSHTVPRNARALQSLMPALTSAARLHVELIDSGYRSPITGCSLEHPVAGVIFTDESGRIVETNQTAERILRAGDGLTIVDGRIRARRNFETAKLAELISHATASNEKDLAARCLLISRDSARPSFVVRVTPVSGGLASFNLPMAMVLVSVPDEGRVTEGELAELYGLSPAESRLAMAVASGKRLRDLVDEFGVQITTLRTQLSSILRKCEVERQSDLVRLISNIPVVRLATANTSLPDTGMAVIHAAEGR